MALCLWYIVKNDLSSVRSTLVRIVEETIEKYTYTDGPYVMFITIPINKSLPIVEEKGVGIYGQNKLIKRII